jgi:outer membrane protein assembly factor BamB
MSSALAAPERSGRAAVDRPAQTTRQRRAAIPGFRSSVAMLSLLLAGPAAAQLAVGGWPMAGNDLRHTGQSPYVGPHDPAIQWRAETSGYVKGSPIVGPDGTVYLGLVKGLCSVDPEIGEAYWCSQLSGVVRRNAPAIATDGTLYIGERANRLWAFDDEGDAKWFFAVGNDGDVNTSPAIAPDGAIYMAGTFNGVVHALEPDGELRWRLRLGFPVSYSSPAIAPDGTIYVGTVRGLLFAITDGMIEGEPAGVIKWTANVRGGIRFGSPSIASDGTIYIGSKRGLSAIQPTDGSIRWHFDDTGTVATTPAIATDGTIYVAGLDGFFALNPDGSQKWSLESGERFRSSPAIGADGIIYVAAEKRLLALQPADGEILWEYTFGRVVLSAPAIGPNGALYIGADGFYAFKDEEE